MKLAKIVLPVLDNAGHDLWDAHRGLQTILINEFGGFTSYEGLGGWRNLHGKLFKERVVIYDVAMERAAAPKLREIAGHLARDARQESVMIVTPNGDVEFVPQDENKVAATA